MYNGTPLSCAMLSVFPRDVYFIDGVLVTYARVASVWRYVYLMMALRGQNILLSLHESTG
jgi:hypothetical protein